MYLNNWEESNRILHMMSKEFPDKPNETNYPVRLIKKWQTGNKKVNLKLIKNSKINALLNLIGFLR